MELGYSNDQIPEAIHDVGFTGLDELRTYFYLKELGFSEKQIRDAVLELKPVNFQKLAELLKKGTNYYILHAVIIYLPLF